MKLLKSYKLIYIFAIVLLTQANCCEGDFDTEPKYPKNVKGRPEYEWLVTVSAEQFNKNAVGSGWKWKSTERITENGETEAFVFVGNGYPLEYYFTPDSVWIFRYYQDRNIRQCSSFVYDETENLVVSPLIKYMQICRLDSSWMMTIEQAGDMGYFVNYYDRMLPFELNARMLGFEPVAE
jgi:hypothetical protein